MAKIIIDIDDEEYNRLEYIDIFKLQGYIKNATVLPKGHGRLIDADKLPISSIDITDLPIGRGLATILLEDIEYAETVIEADKENKDGSNNN